MQADGEDNIGVYTRTKNGAVFSESSLDYSFEGQKQLGASFLSELNDTVLERCSHA
jgi:hypothetical protein